MSTHLRKSFYVYTREDLRSGIENFTQRQIKTAIPLIYILNLTRESNRVRLETKQLLIMQNDHVCSSSITTQKNEISKKN